MNLGSKVRFGAERVHASMLSLPLSPDPLSIGPNTCWWIWAQASSSKQQATSLPQLDGKKNYEKKGKSWAQ